ncbi:SMI1/KNR4 family protein [Deinococcus sp.]|uniref:SMI1/KNR4 family protein n=1 Tax=Deinococcus sp. TaxID=47478 RepID=UPI00286EA3F5|nr:SMI1/KNR4 family protein [Deinococcus sp.]
MLPLQVMQDRLDTLEFWLAEHAPMTCAVLNPGVEEAGLEAFEAELGLTLPEEFKMLYRWHDGQAESEVTTEPGVFGLPFTPLAQVWDVWRSLRDTLTQHPNTSTEVAALDAQVSHPARYIREVFLDPGRVPFCCTDDWNAVGIDLNPGPLGTPGQVITFGQDEHDKYVLAGSLGEFIDEYVRRLEQGRVRVHQPDGDQFPDDPFMLELQVASGEFVESVGFLVDLFPGFGVLPTP